MRMLLIGLLFLLAGCGTNTPVSNQVAAVQEATTKACGFLPTAASVAAMLTAGNPTVVGVSALAAAICQAVGNKSLGLFSDSQCIKINEVCIDGEFVDVEKQ